MKKLIFVIGFLFLLGKAYSQWVWQNPYPVGSHLEDCFFTTENTGYVVGWDGAIIKTTNNGNNWIQLYSGSNRFFYSVYFTNQQTGYIISGDVSFPVNNVLLKTTDMGGTWDQIYTFNNAHLSCIKFINNNTGFIVGGTYWSGGNIYKTTNSGINWIQYIPNPTTNFINSIFFVNDSVGYVAGDDSRILKTTNTGANWISQIQGPPYIELNSIYFLNSNSGIAVGSGGRLFKTNNGGVNWSVDSTGVSEDLWDIKFKDINTGYITVGGSYVYVTGKILRTTNSGNTWEILQTNNIQNYRGISVIGNIIFAVGYWGTVIRSTNDGFNWTDLSNSMISNNIFDSYIFDSLKCIVVCDSSKVLRTSDGGNNWITLNLGGNYRLNSVYFINHTTGYVAGGYSVYYPPYSTFYYSKIFKSTDGGVNWNLIYGFNNETSEIKSIRFINDSTGCCIGSGGIFRRTNNGGLNWSTQNLGSNWLYSINFINLNTGYICGYNGNIYKTTNAGYNWILLNSGTTSNLHSIAFPSDSIGYVAGYNNQIFKTINGGMNWISYNINLSYEFDINGISFINNNIGFATGVSFPDYGRAGDIVKTTNGGQTWDHLSVIYSYPTFQRRGLNSIHFLNSKLGFIVGEHSTILKTTNGGNTVEITKISVNIPNSISLSQNYPNPFNPSTNIKYQIANNLPRQVTLKVYNILGKEIATLVNEKQNAGTYEVTFDARHGGSSTLTSGIYFYRLICSDFSETKKMVLLK